MSAIHRIGLGIAGLLLALLAGHASAEASCRIAFDMGSSGIRAGASNNQQTTRADLDYLGPLWAGRGLEELVAPTLSALRDLPVQAGFTGQCERVGGGFSAWRLAAQQDAAALAGILARLHAGSDVAVLVMPQAQEGGYGYFGARQLLGERLTTSHVLDIGGGSLQIAGERTSFGDALGQKIWHRHLCQEIRNSESAPCHLQPLTGDELAIARSLAAEKLSGVGEQLGGPVSMTAISRPVSRGILPVLNRLEGGQAGGFRQAALSAAIDRLAGLSSEETVAWLGGSPSHAAYLLSDMLLVEGLMRATGSDYLHVAEVDLTNLPGLLADDRAYAWGRHYTCYLDRLVRLGPAAYATDLASCP